MQLLFAPTETAKEHLLKEGKNHSHIYVTGNTVIDALKTTVDESFRMTILSGQRAADLYYLPRTEERILVRI